MFISIRASDTARTVVFSPTARAQDAAEAAGQASAGVAAVRLQRRPRPDWRLGVIVFLVFVLPLLVPLDPYGQNMARRLQAPSWHWQEAPLGTDQLGRDILARLLYGGRVSLLIGITSVVVSVLVGLPLGLLAGYVGGHLDTVIMRVVDVQLGFPSLLLALAILALFGPSVPNLVIVMAFARWTLYARVVRAEVLVLKEREFVAAARALGASGLRVIRRHLLPNAVPSLIVIMTLQVADMILFESAFSFLGMGVQPPDASWGRMFAEAREFLTRWWLSVLPGAAITLTVAAVNLIGEGLGKSR
jgi:peptide/nickel transport system permease protein